MQDPDTVLIVERVSALAEHTWSVEVEAWEDTIHVASAY